MQHTVKSQRTAGILLSYCNTALNMASSFLLVPMLLSALTDGDYSLYRVMQSFAGALMMFNLGLSKVTARSIARHAAGNTPESRREKDSTLALAAALSLAMAAVVSLLGLGMEALLPTLFGSAYSPAQLETGGKLVRIFAAATALHILSDTFRGCAQGHERFLFLQGATMFHYLFRFAAMFALIRWTKLSIVSLALVDLWLYAGLLGLNFLYARLKLGEKVRFSAIRRREFAPISAFSAAILLQAVINQVNSNLDTVILGAAAAEPVVITMYSSGLTIYTVYSSLIGVFSGIYLPSAARLTAKDADGEALTDFVIPPGRIQAMLALGILGGFGLFGGEFISLWIGDAYRDAHPLALALMLCATVPLVQNMCLSILDARLNQLFRSAVLLGMAALNAALSLILVKPLGYWGTALGTILSALLGDVALMNLYYTRKLKLNIRRMLRKIFSGTLGAGLLCCAFCLPLCLRLAGNVPVFLLKCLIFCGIYAVLLWKMALDPGEKERLRNIFHKKGAAYEPM